MAGDLRDTVAFLEDRLYYVALRGAPPASLASRAHFFSIDNELVYWNFFLDFGPLNLGQLYRFSTMLNRKLEDPALKHKIIYFYSGTHPHRRTNAAFLICAWALLYLDRTPEEAYRPFRGVYPPFPPFHDASPCACTFDLNILDCLRGLLKARKYNFFDFDNFDIEEYEHFEQVENGDLNWIVKDKFLAFAGPHEHRTMTPDGYQTLTPDDYTPYYRKKNVSLVIRLNKKYYDENKFIAAGSSFLELYYLDGSNPPIRLLNKFLAACEATSGAIAVHCKAGLGRTGTCIGCYIMKHYKFTAAEVIGWIRICRPGSIIGPQQHFVREMEQTLWREGDLYRKQQSLKKARVAEDSGKAGHDGLSNGMGSLAINAEGGEAASESKGASRPNYRNVDGNIGKTDAQLDAEAAEDKNSQGDSLRSRRQLHQQQRVPATGANTSWTRSGASVRK